MLNNCAKTHKIKRIWKLLKTKNKKKYLGLLRLPDDIFASKIWNKLLNKQRTSID